MEELSRSGSDFVTPRDAARMLGVRLETVYGLIWVGRLEAKKSEGRWLICRSGVMARRAAKRPKTSKTREER